MIWHVLVGGFNYFYITLTCVSIIFGPPLLIALGLVGAIKVGRKLIKV